MKRVIWLAGWIFITLFACEKREEIVVGLAVPITGPASAFGIGMKNAMILVRDDWNAKGGVLGKKVRLVVEDDASDPNQGRTVAKRLVGKKVVGVIGHLNSSVTIPASEIYNASRLVNITPASTNPEVTERRLPYVFRSCWRDDQQGDFVALFVAQYLKVNRVAILDDQKTYGRGLADVFENKARELGLKIVFRDHIREREQDYKAVLTKIRESNPEALFYGGEYAEFGLLIKQGREIGMTDIYYLSGDGSRDVQLFDRAGTKKLDRVFVSFGLLTPAVADFEKRYLEKFKIPMNAFSPYTYVAGDLLLQAVAATKSTDPDIIATFLKSHKFSSLIGEIEFDEKGDLKKTALEMEQATEGTFISLPWYPE